MDAVTGHVWSRRMRVAIVIPARDEQPTVAAVVVDARAAVPGARVIVVDDASRDLTAAAARSAGAEVVALARHAGYAGALLAGYRHAMRGDPDAVVQMDADGQHRACDIPVLLHALDPADMVVGSRFLGPAPGYRIPALRRTGMAACRWMAASVGGLALSDPTSGLRAMGPGVAGHIAGRGFPSGLTETSLLIHLHRRGFRIAEVPVRMQAATSRSMHAGLAGGVHMMRIAWTVAGMRRAHAAPRATPRRPGHAAPAPAPAPAQPVHAPVGLPEPPL